MVVFPTLTLVIFRTIYDKRSAHQCIFLHDLQRGNSYEARRNGVGSSPSAGRPGRISRFRANERLRRSVYSGVLCLCGAAKTTMFIREREERPRGDRQTT